MRMKFSVCICMLLIGSFFCQASVAGQSTTQPKSDPKAAEKESKRKQKEFGSSLKRLKWNPITREATESAPVTKTTDDEDDVIRVDTSLIAWDVLVVDKAGNPVQGLKQEDFAIAEEGIPQEVGHFLLGDSQNVGRSIVLIIDYSGSQYRFLHNSVDAAKVLVDQLQPLDKMAIVTDDIELILDFTTDKKKLKSKLESLIDRTKQGPAFFGFGRTAQFGKSQQYSALIATLNEMFTEADKRPIVVFQTDGDEIYRLRNPVLQASIPPDLPEEARNAVSEQLQLRQRWYDERRTEFSLADVYRTAEKSRATIYTVIPGIQLVGRTPEDQQKLVRFDVEKTLTERMAQLDKGRADRLRKEYEERWRPLSDENIKASTRQQYLTQFALAAVAGRTGGWTDFLERPEQASSIYQRIFSDINQRYIIGYYPSNKERDGKRRRISVEVKGHPEYTILGRKSYYAPLDSQ
jgi:VWFA-related protein